MKQKTIRLGNSNGGRIQAQQPSKPQIQQQRSDQYQQHGRAQSREQYQSNVPRAISPVPQAHPMESFYQGGLTSTNMGQFPATESTVEHDYFDNNSEYHNPFNTSQQQIPRVQPQINPYQRS